MPTVPWTWDPRLSGGRGGYRNTATGRTISAKQMVELRDQFTDAMKDEARKLTERLPNGQESMGSWLTDMRALIKDAYVDQYVLARGGRSNMTAGDWGRLGGMLGNQYKWLQQMAEDMCAGKLTGAQMEARAAQYLESSTQAYERGRAAEKGIDLPQFPGDGSTDCGGNCRCAWDIVEEEDAFNCTWVMDPSAEHCGDCEGLAAQYNPLVIPKGA
jgi:hypothetical protein